MEHASISFYFEDFEETQKPMKCSPFYASREKVANKGKSSYNDKVLLLDIDDDIIQNILVVYFYCKLQNIL